MYYFSSKNQKKDGGGGGYAKQKICLERPYIEK
jgi:hypothetical protein